MGFFISAELSALESAQYPLPRADIIADMKKPM